MNSFFQTIENCSPQKTTMSVTVIKGVHAGEKAVISDGILVYVSCEDGLIKAHEKELTGLMKSCLLEMEGEEIYAESIGHEKKMVICGCGHVSMPIITLGKMAGFHVTAIDDRTEFAEKARDAGADRVLAESFAEALSMVESDPFTYFVIVTRGHHWDEECLRLIAGMPCAYIGMMGSKRRVSMVKEKLVKEGVTRDVIDRVHAPIGLDIGAETPEEIGISVMAEIIACKQAKKDVAMPSDILRAINGSPREGSEDGRRILATIVRKEGSAPREAGTKMLIMKKETVNTIGGGLLEARVMEAAGKMLAAPCGKPQLLRFSLSADAASAEGEVCGGTVDVFLEEIC